MICTDPESDIYRPYADMHIPYDIYIWACTYVHTHMQVSTYPYAHIYIQICEHVHAHMRVCTPSMMQTTSVLWTSAHVHM